MAAGGQGYLAANSCFAGARSAWPEREADPLWLRLDEIELHDCGDGLLQRIDLRPIIKQFGFTTLSIQRSDLHQVLRDHLSPKTCQLNRRCAGFG